MDPEVGRVIDNMTSDHWHSFLKEASGGVENPVGNFQCKKIVVINKDKTGVKSIDDDSSKDPNFEIAETSELEDITNKIFSKDESINQIKRNECFEFIKAFNISKIDFDESLGCLDDPKIEANLVNQKYKIIKVVTKSNKNNVIWKTIFKTQYTENEEVVYFRKDLFEIITNGLFEKVKNVTRSADGISGVLLIDFDYENSEKFNRVAVKFINSPERIIIADVIFEKSGFIVPDSVYFSLNSKLGKKIVELLRHHKGESFRRRKMKGSSQYIKKELPNNNYLMVSTFLDATPVIQSDPGQFMEFIRNPKMARNLGRMMIIDAFIGNTDRLSIVKVNPGNFMINNQEAELFLIDSQLDCTKKQNKTYNLFNIRQLISGYDGDSKFIVKKCYELLLNFMKKNNNNFDFEKKLADSKEEIVDNMREGILEGAYFLLELFPDRDAVERFVREVWEEKTDQFEPETIAGAIEEIKNLLQKNVG